MPCALKSCSHYVQNSLKEIVPLEQVGEAGPPLEPNSRYATDPSTFYNMKYSARIAKVACFKVQKKCRADLINTLQPHPSCSLCTVLYVL